MIKISITFLSLCIATLFIFTLQKYPGNWMIYALFTLSLNFLFAAGFRKNRIFFDTFIGIFFWIGFWLKLSIRVAFFNGEFIDPVGTFNKLPEQYDRALLVTSCGVIALLVATFIREKLIFTYNNLPTPKPHEATELFYLKHRIKILSFFTFCFFAVAISNAYFGIYQRGQSPRLVLPFGLSGLYTWLLFFGFASFSAVFMNIELKNKSSLYLITLLSLLEAAISNISMISRGMIINGTTLLYGLNEAAKKQRINLSGYFKFIVLSIFAVVFVASALSVNYVRNLLYLPSAIANPISTLTYSATTPTPSPPKVIDPVEAAKIKVAQEILSQKDSLKNLTNNTAVLFIDRIVGIEGVIAISNHPSLGWNMVQTALSEKYETSGTSFYDMKVAVNSPYRTMTNNLNHFVSLPGILAFMFYPGSYFLLFFCMLLISLIASAIELLTFKLSGANLILCSLIAQMITYRYVHFGYVPKQSYLLFGSIIGNILIIYFLEKLFQFCNLRKYNIK